MLHTNRILLSVAESELLIISYFVVNIRHVTDIWFQMAGYPAVFQHPVPGLAEKL